ncbi:23S rRNA (adenine(1618)-N(6))-methyltransferase RlmF [Anditalea andensis]|uniref:23S rRNA (adenine(1618)-N(6))-methyltransferase RlmF n=1 Tax=Anditalea andensis TaxID=1048983 RepID=UPI00068BCD89|nr:23S rRNA (adenine(1618)-N(6))-methyltransferase RlmF [Anditalea andensis]
MTDNPKAGLHPHNIHRFGYDFEALIQADHGLGVYVRLNPYGNLSIDFTDPKAVLALNKAILKSDYGIQHWDIPAGNLCPPIPGRADYIYYLAELLDTGVSKGLTGLDIGTGASGIYPLIGASKFGWKFICTDIDPLSLSNVCSILDHNPSIKPLITCRLQPHTSRIFRNVWHQGEKVDFTMCNPPFHASAKEAAQATHRKNRNLSINSNNKNFGGNKNELWFPGGEQRFVSNMIQESIFYKMQCRWFTSLISKKESLPLLYKKLQEIGANYKVIEMAQGQKKSRILAWHF